jgi:hypothetical protein
MSMATTTDYDAPRKTVTTDDSLEGLQARRTATKTTEIDADEDELAAAFVTTGTDQELTAAVVPMRTDEFQCGRCFLIHHRSRRAIAGQDLCDDCA